MSWDISVMVLTRRGIKRGGYLGRPSWKADGVDGSPANGLFDHGLDVGQVLAVVDGRESVSPDDAVDLGVGAALGVGEEDHGHHPPCEDAECGLASGAKRE